MKAQQGSTQEYLALAMAYHWRRLTALEQEKQKLTQSIKRIETELQRLLKRG